MLLAVCGAFAGCTSAPQGVGGGGERGAPVVLAICHGFGCKFTTRVGLTPKDERALAGYFRSVRTAKAERDAISRAVKYAENRATAVIGIRDRAKSSSREAGHAGQMDCIDESGNTRALLLYLARKGLLRHHTVERNVSRGFLLDGRYFHSTAVIRETGGRSWAVDSWYEPAGGAPDIMLVDEWRVRGVMGER